jgi:hypothetical protein
MEKIEVRDTVETMNIAEIMDSTDITVMTDVNYTRKIRGNMDVADQIHKKQTSRTSQSS